ncbi:uncharacterized protein Dana_GF10675, isoform C [Drosophila ananassae]|uniref:Uncharacterized protein, isoform C n=1 Tax=Drosophila ananassae TaxID=7217 RepID=A0A0N8P129_DROAN|nr:uncharacterized protein LOC6493543 isoform X1 [Drosophila ananassae]KPU78772.1 uncharacterized protein Dana_GF10675, isoform C [Drosophila ananassae]
MTTIMSLSHFELFRILDYMKWNCERQHSLEAVPLVKYLDIFNFAASCRRFRRIVLDWSEDIYYQLGIDPLQKNLHKHLTVPFNEIHSIRKRTTKKGKENFIDIYISAMMKELTLKSIEMTYKPQENIMNHDEIFEKLLKAVRGEETRRQFSVLNQNALKNLGDLLLSNTDIDGHGDSFVFNDDKTLKVKELILDIAELDLEKKTNSKNKVIVDSQNIQRLNGILSEIKDCELRRSDDRKEFIILSREIILKIIVITEIKDRGRWDSINRMEYEPVDSKQKAKINRIFMDISDCVTLVDDFRNNFRILKSSIFPQVKQIFMDLTEKKDVIIMEPKNIPKFKEVTVNISDRRISDLGLFRHISKLNLTASFEIADLVEFCKQNQGLVSLDINVSSFADHRKLSEIVGHCPLLKQLKFVLNDNAGDNDYVRLANLDRLQQLEIVKPPSHAYIIEDDEGFISKRPRIENEIEALSEGINQSFESNVAVHELLKAISVKKRSLLANLTLKFNVEDEILQTIAKIKSIRILECGICDVKSINHLKDSPVLKRLVLLNKGHLISDDIVHFVKKQVKVSNLDTEITLYFNTFLRPHISGHLYIETKCADIYRNAIAEPLLNIENLQRIYLSDDLIQLRGSCFIKGLLENGIQLISKDCEMILEPIERALAVVTNFEVLLPEVENLKSFYYGTSYPSDIILHQLCAGHSKTLEEIDISIHQIIFDMGKEAWLNEAQVKILASFTCLKHITFGLKQLKNIQNLFNLTNLEKIEILSEHNPKFVSFSRFLTPILQKCKKLNYLEIKIVSQGLTRKFLISLQHMVLKERQSESENPLEVCLILRPMPVLTENQKKLIKRPFEGMTLTIKIHEDDYLFD